MRNHFLAVLLFFALVGATLAMAWPDLALASDYKGPVNQKLGIGTTFGRWPDGIVPWVYNPTDKAAGLGTNAKFVERFQEAIAELEGVSGLTFVYQGIDNSADFAENDGVVVVGWAPLGGSTAGQAGPSSSCSGQDIIDLGYCQYVDGSVKFDNDGSTNWDKGAADFTDRNFKQIAVHELLHLVGIGHSEVGISIMFADPYTNLSHPREDDISALQSLYGEPDEYSQASIYLPPGAGASPVTASCITLSDDQFGPPFGNGCISDIDGSETANSVGFYWAVQGPNTDDWTWVVTDPHGFYYKGAVDDRDCNGGGTCGLWTSFTSVEGIFTFPGVWTVYLIYNGALAATESVTVTTSPEYNQAPDSTFTQDVIYGPAPLTVDMKLSVTGDNEGDDVDATWHIPTVGQIILDSGNFGGSAGTHYQTVTFDTPGVYEIYVEVNDSWGRYNPGTGAEAGPGFRTLYRRVVNVTKVSDDVTTFMDVTGDAIPDLAALTGGPSSKPKLRVFSGGDGSVHSTVGYLTGKWRDIAIATVRDANQNGNANDPAVALLADHDVSNKIIVETRRLDTGAKIGKTAFKTPKWRAIDVVVIDDTNGDGNTDDTSIAVLLQHRTNGKISLQIRMLGTGTLLKDIDLLSNKWIAIAAAVVNRAGQSPLIGVLAEHRTNGKRQVQSLLVSTGAVDRNIKFFNSDATVKDVTAIHDLDGAGPNNDPGWQVLAIINSNKSIKVQTRRVDNGSLDSTVSILSSTWEGLRLDSALDMNGNNSHELAVSTMKRSSGKRRIHVKDFQSGDVIQDIYP
jgi:hypothetical protein